MSASSTTARIRIALPESNTRRLMDTPKPFTELFELRAGADHAAKALSKGNKAQIVRRDSRHAKIYGRGPYTIEIYIGGKRHRWMRNDFAGARKCAFDQFDALDRAQAELKGITQTDLIQCREAKRILEPTGKPIVLAASEYAAAIKDLAGEPLADAIRFYRENRPAGVTNKTVPEIVAELLAGNKDERGDRWSKSLKGQLKRFAESFPSPLHVVRAPEINDWLSRQGKSGYTRRNYRGAVLQLVIYAKGHGHIPASWDELNAELVKPPKLKDLEITILTAKQVRKMLTCAPENMKAFLAISAFSGIRHAELKRISWRNVDLEERLIYVPKKSAKTGQGRPIPLSDNLVQWLTRYQQDSGPITNLVKTCSAIGRIKTAAKIPAGKNQTRNALRKSFISYRLAVVKNRAQVAEEAGTSLAMIKKHYNQPIPEKEGKEWFNVCPTDADVLQLNFKIA